jgi:hypothetical protein
MKKLKKDRSQKRKTGFGSNNRLVLVALAGAITGLAVTYLLESEKGRTMLSQAGSSLKAFAGNLKLPAMLRA